ncbi:retrovirus-related Pol polyprotein from transposon 17.6 [Trichonephila clavipes]|nr:retrovirus-related Pol polyprotein from transposon 17.6 [Trichonephila clavipes]
MKLISDNGSQFISDIFEKLSEILQIRHVKTVVYRPQANRTQHVNRHLEQMIANYVNEQHGTCDQFLREFAYAIRTAVNETTVGDIERLFEDARQNTKTKHEKWEKYYNRIRRDVQIKMNYWVLTATHPLSVATRKMVAKFKPKFEGPYRVLDVKNNNVVRGRHNREEQFDPEKTHEGTTTPTLKSEQNQATGMPDEAGPINNGRTRKGKERVRESLSLEVLAGNANYKT